MSDGGLVWEKLLHLQLLSDEKVTEIYQTGCVKSYVIFAADLQFVSH